MSDKTSKQPVTIKKYANRRLYNTATSTYVTLEDLSVMVKKGEDFNVYDAKTSEDITRSVLTQIIMEEENKTGQQNLLPINFLRQLIGFYGNNLQWMVPKYLEHSMEVLTGNQDKIQDYFKTSFGNMFPFGTTLEEMSKQNLSMFENTMRLFSPFGLGLGNNLMNTSASPNSKANSAVSQPSSTASSSSNQSCSLSSTNATNANASSNAAASPASSNTSNNSNTNIRVTSSVDTNTSKPTASVTSLKPRTETQNTPMPNVSNLTSSTASDADDMQQKIANLQRQLADLAKSRA